MKLFNESEIKYLAGLLDADGCLSFQFVDGKLYMEMSLAASESIDRHGYIDSLGERLGSVNIRHYPGTNWSPSHQWRLFGRKHLNLFLPRVVKHMVIKGAHWKRMYDKWVELKGVSLTESQIEELKEWSQESRKQSGPIKPKNHPTWAWVAGYLDGDGYYSLTQRKKTLSASKIGCCCHMDDRVAIDLLVKAFGGSVRQEGTTLRWYRSMGKQSKSFAVPFLKKVHTHSRLKKWKIEQMLAYHNQLQRLTEECPEG